MNKQIVEQIKKYIAEIRQGDRMKSLRKSEYVNGYMAGMDDIEGLIEFAESLAGVTADAKFGE